MIREGQGLALGHRAAELGPQFLDSLLNLLPFPFIALVKCARDLSVLHGWR